MSLSQLPPYKALSVKQPWANLIIHGGKNIENRTWRTNYRGWFLVHASKKMTPEEYGDVVRFCASIGSTFTLPRFDQLQLGGIIGMARICDCVHASGSPWFVGPWGFVIAEVKPLPFTPCKGSLGFFTPKP